MKSFYERHPVMMFVLRFILIAPFVLSIWWYFSPKYAWLLGQMTGACINLFGDVPIDAMEVRTLEGSVLNTDIILEFGSGDKKFPIHISRFMNNISPFIALVLASPSVAFLRRIKILAGGIVILILGQIFFLVTAFLFAQEIARATEIPTAFGLFLMTLPFMLWIVFVYWERLAEYIADAMPDEDATEETTTTDEEGTT